MVKRSRASGQSSGGVWVEDRAEICFFFFQIFQNCSIFQPLLFLCLFVNLEFIPFNFIGFKIPPAQFWSWGCVKVTYYEVDSYCDKGLQCRAGYLNCFFLCYRLYTRQMMMLTKVINESSFMTASEEEDHYKFTRNLTRWNILKIMWYKKVYILN